MTDLPNHLRFALRQLRKNPGFSLTAILTLAIGIGATTAIFSLFYAVLLKPLPFPQSERLMQIQPLDFPPNATPGAKGVAADDTSYPDFLDWRAQSHAFESIAAYHNLNVSDRASGEAKILAGVTVSSDFFHVLGVTPALGRSFTRDEEKAGNRSVVISHELWVSDFNASPSVLGQSMRLFDESYTVVGVMPASFSFPVQTPAPSLWITPARDAEGKNPSFGQRGWRQLSVVGRLKRGVTIDRARADMDTVQARLAKQYPDNDRNSYATLLTPEMEAITGNVRPALRVLFAAVAALLLIACANVAGLLLARGSSRQAELAVRAALGASRREIVFQLLNESMLLSLIGGAAGVVLASLMLRALLHLVPAGVPRVDQASIDGTVLAFSFAVSVATGILFGLLPARRLAQLDPALALRDGTRTSTAGRKQHRLHSTLVIAETALGLVLLVGAGLLVRSFLHTLAVDPGFNPRHVLTFRIGLSPARYKEDAASLAFYRELTTRLDSLPGVRSATSAFPLPLSGSDINITFNLEGQPTNPGDSPAARASLVDSSFFSTLEIPLLSGRAFSEAENQSNGKRVIIVNQAFVRKFLPGQRALGKRIQTGFDEDDSGVKHWREIIGVAGDVKRGSKIEESLPEYYMPYAQTFVTMPYLAVRVAGDPNNYINSIRATVASLDKDAPVYRVRSYDELLSTSTAQPRFQTMLLTAFASIALLLAAIGLYAVLSYMVVQRTHEIGLRMALGAQRANVLTLILSRGMKLAAAGLALGIVVSAALTRFLAGQLYGIKPLDPLTFIMVGLMLLLVSAIASLVPARRAARLDPMQTLRDQ